MKILIADSGSTKTDWCLIEHGKRLAEVQTGGINPYHQSEEEIEVLLSNGLAEPLSDGMVDAIYFYGAGCGEPDKQQVVEHALKGMFPKAKISIDSDMVGCCHALLGKDPGVACIMGTGSNSCRYDGEKIIEQVPAGGYILGDEGSGAVLGRLLASDYLKGQLPKALKSEFEKEYELSIPTLLQKVYKEPMANRYLAQFTPFLLKHLEEPIIYNLVFDAMDSFVRRNIMQYSHHDALPLMFVGSIAFYFHDVIEVVLQEYGLSVHTVLKSPMEGLISYYSEVKD